MKIVTAFILVAGFVGYGSLVSCSSLPDVAMPDVPPTEKKTYTAAYDREGDIVYEFKHDAVELDPRYKDIFAGIDDEVDQALRFHQMRGKLGFSHIFDAKKREILWKKYGIDWHPFSALNPKIMVD